MPFQGQQQADPQPGDTNKTDYEKANLDVQRRLADATDEIVRLTAVAVRLTEVAIIVAFVETVFFIYTVLLTRRANRLAAEATKIADRALKTGDRPHMVSDVVTMFDPPSRSGGQDFMRFGYAIKNYGNSPAWVREYDGWLQIVAPHVEPSLGPVRTTNRTVCPVPPGKVFEKDYIPRKGITEQQITAIALGTLIVYFLGYVIYTDAHGQEHMSRYLYRYDADMGAFEPFDHREIWFYS